MKKTLLIIIAIVAAAATSYAQNDVYFNINHKLGNTAFAMNSACANNLGNEFMFTRLEYYICEFTIVHDGGQEIEVNDLWVLVKANENNSIDLGNHDVTNVESITFKLGVDPEHNHLDPSTFESSHPLAPQNPSMHWGWNPGYRFIALEGDAGTEFNQGVELHGLGDGNYFTIEVDVEAVAYAGAVFIDVIADYERGLEDINISAGLIVHSEAQEARTLLQNMRDYVFTANGAVSISENEIAENALNVYPNPSTDGNVILELNASDVNNYEVSVTDICGKQVAYFDNVTATTKFDLNIEQAGFYLVNLISKGQIISSQKLISK